MSFRWDDRFTESEDQVSFTTPLAPEPEGSELIGAQTPLGVGRVRWTNSAKAWIVGEDFELPLSHFDPSTIKPIFAAGTRPDCPSFFALGSAVVWVCAIVGVPVAQPTMALRRNGSGLADDPLPRYLIRSPPRRRYTHSKK